MTEDLRTVGDSRMLRRRSEIVPKTPAEYAHEHVILTEHYGFRRAKPPESRARIARSITKLNEALAR